MTDSTQQSQAPTKGISAGVSRLRRLATGPYGVWARGAVLLALAGWLTLTYADILGKTYPVEDWLFWRIAPLWLYNLVMWSACVSAGYGVLHRLGIELPGLETLVQSAALGLLVLALGMYAGGFLGLWGWPYSVALAVLMLAAGARPLYRFAQRALGKRRLERALRPLSPTGRFLAWAAVVFGVIGVLFVYLPVLTPKAINFDARWYHLPIAETYAREGRIVPFIGDYNKNLPHLASIVHTWGWFLPVHDMTSRWTLPLHTEFFAFLWTLAGVSAMARWLVHGMRLPGAWAAFFLFPAIFVYDSNLAGAADHFLAFWAVPVFLAAVRASRTLDWRHGALLGAVTGGALLTKYQAIYLISGATLILLVGLVAHAWRLWRRSAISASAREATYDEPEADWFDAPGWRVLLRRAGLLAAAVTVVGLVVVLPHFGKNWAFYGNPLYPFAQSVFPSHPTTENAAFLVDNLLKDQKWVPQGTLAEKLRNAAKIFVTFSWKPHYSFTDDIPSFGSLFTLTLPLLPFVRRPGRPLLGVLAGAAALFTWAMTYVVDRYLQAFVPLLAATTLAILVRAWQLGWLGRLAACLLVGIQVVWGGDAMFYGTRVELDTAVSLVRGASKGERGERIEFRREYRQIRDALPEDALVIRHHFRRTLGIDRNAPMDWPGQQGWILYADLGGPRALYDYYKQLGVTHFLHVPGWRVAWNKQDEVLIAHFLIYAPDKQRFGRHELVTMPDRPPPPDPDPYYVLAYGLWGYENGLHPLKAMSTYEDLPEDVRSFPEVEVPWPADEAAQLQLLGRATAVVEKGLPGNVRTVVQKELVNARSYSRSITVWVRRSNQPPLAGP